MKRQRRAQAIAFILFIVAVIGCKSSNNSNTSTQSSQSTSSNTNSSSSNKPAPATHANIAGKYTITGTNPNGTMYRGALEVIEHGDVYEIFIALCGATTLTASESSKAITSPSASAARAAALSLTKSSLMGWKEFGADTEAIGQERRKPRNSKH